jgi:hypothetical protein
MDDYGLPYVAMMAHAIEITIEEAVEALGLTNDQAVLGTTHQNVAATIGSAPAFA